MENEKFVDSPIFPSKYLVSNFGTVITKKTGLVRKSSVNKDGYLYLKLHDNGQSKYTLIHRLVAMAFVENDDPEVNQIINHKDGVKTNNHAGNLEWCDVGHNTRHSYSMGLQKPVVGDKHGRSVYSDVQIRDVCRLLQDTTLSIEEISTKTNVAKRTVQSVRARENWNCVSNDYVFPDRRLKGTCND